MIVIRSFCFCCSACCCPCRYAPTAVEALVSSGPKASRNPISAHLACDLLEILHELAVLAALRQRRGERRERGVRRIRLSAPDVRELELHRGGIVVVALNHLRECALE